MPRIYLDMCCYCRPFDNNSQSRILLEAEAVLRIVDAVRDKKLHLISSDIVTAELLENPKEDAVAWIDSVLEFSFDHVQLTSNIEHEAVVIVASGIRPKDALHVASALAGNAEYFCTCDDRLLKKLQATASVNIQALNPIEIVNRGLT